MTDALDVIRNEHRNLRALLMCLQGLVDDIGERHLKPDYQIFDLIMDYLASYLDRFHHPKEDAYLFDRLSKRDAESAEIIAVLEKEHAQERPMQARLRNALADFRKQGAPAFPAFRDAVSAYVEFERRHALAEEELVFERAKTHLTAADWAEINAAFEANEDPLFGEGPKEHYRELFREITTRVPAPHGYGAAWTKED
jgi:hemerythrin-like domain-containing protein